MKRRDFIKKSACFGVGAGVSMILGSYDFLYGSGTLKPEKPDLAAVMGGEADKMFVAGIQAMGGIRRFVKPNQTVVIKPNIGWDTKPERGADTNPLLIRQIIKQCIDAGTKKVYVFDHTVDNWQKCYENSGIKYEVRNAGGKMVPGNTYRHYAPITIDGGKQLKKAHVHELFLEADVFINVPVLKHHSSANLTIGMKNLMGVVWDRGWWHWHGLNRCIADFATFRRPDLTVIDAYRVLKTNGPRGVSVQDVIPMRSQILSIDPVAGDTAAAKLFGNNPSEIRYIKQAHDMGVGTMDLSKLAIRRIRL